MYSNISQILLPYKTWRYYNKFDSAKSLVVCYLCAKIQEYGYMEHGLKYCVLCSKTYSSPSSLVITFRWFATSRLRAPASVRLVICLIPLKFDRRLGCAADAAVRWHGDIIILTSKVAGYHDMVAGRLTSQCIDAHSTNRSIAGSSINDINNYRNLPP